MPRNGATQHCQFQSPLFRGPTHRWYYHISGYFGPCPLLPRTSWWWRPEDQVFSSRLFLLHRPFCPWHGCCGCCCWQHHYRQVRMLWRAIFSILNRRAVHRGCFDRTSHPSLENLSTGALTEHFTNGTIILIACINIGKWRWLTMLVGCFCKNGGYKSRWDPRLFAHGYTSSGRQERQNSCCRGNGHESPCLCEESMRCHAPNNGSARCVRNWRWCLCPSTNDVECRILWRDHFYRLEMLCWWLGF
jgi:hypothetical protein